MNTKAYRGGIAAMRGTIAPWRCEMTEVKNNWFANVRDMFSGPALALGLMYALSLLSTWLMNVTAYPGFHDFAPWARDVATAAGGVAGVIYALYARWRPYGLLGRAGFWACVSLLAVAPLLMLAGVAWSNALLALVGSCARSATSPFVGVYLVFALMNLTGPQRMGALVVSYAIYFVGLGALEPLASSQASWVQSALEALFVALPLAAVVPLHRKAFPMLCKAGTLGTQSELSPTNPAPFLLLNHRLYVVAALFQAAMGYATTFASSQSYPQPLMPTLGVLVLLAACVAGGLRAADAGRDAHGQPVYTGVWVYPGGLSADFRYRWRIGIGGDAGMWVAVPRWRGAVPHRSLGGAGKHRCT